MTVVLQRCCGVPHSLSKFGILQGFAVRKTAGLNTPRGLGLRTNLSDNNCIPLWITSGQIELTNAGGSQVNS